MMLALIVMGGFTACNDDELADKLESKPVIIHATIAADSRVALSESADGKTKVEWCEGDAFALTIGEKTILSIGREVMISNTTVQMAISLQRSVQEP